MIKGLGMLVLFVFFYFLVRIPIYQTGFDGQDGNGPDIAIFVNQPAKPNYMLAARIEGKEVYVPPLGHPGPMYEAVAISGQIAKKILPAGAFFSENIISTVKIFSSIFQLLIFIGIFLLSKQKNIFLYLMLFLLSVSPIALYNSSEFQLDSSFGLLVTGIFALLLWAYDLKIVPNKILLLLIFFSSVFIGLGKNEWSLLLIISVILALLVMVLRKQAVDFRIWLTVLSGCLVGNIASFLFEPNLYLSGWNLLLGMGQNNTVISKGLKKFIDMNILRSPYTNTCLFLIAYCSYYIIKNLKSVNFPTLLSFIYGALLFFSFFFATWGWSSRYFAPAFIVLTVTSFAIFSVDTKINSLLRKFSILPLIIVVFFGLQTAWFYKVLGDRFNYGKRDTLKTLQQNVKYCVPYLPTEDILFQKNVDYINNHVGVAGAQSMAQQYGRKLCQVN